MSFKKLLIILFIFSAPFSTTVHAIPNSNIVTFDFTGSVTFSDPSLNAPVDSLVSGRFSYDLNAPATIYYSTPTNTYSYYTYEAPDALTVNFSSHTITSYLLQYRLYNKPDNLVDNNGDIPSVREEFILDTYYLAVKLNGINSGPLSLHLLSSSYNALTSNQPPLNLSMFNLWSGGDFRDGNNNALLRFSVSSVTQVPEAQRYVMFLVGLGVIGLMTRRKTLS